MTTLLAPTVLTSEQRNSIYRNYNKNNQTIVLITTSSNPTPTKTSLSITLCPENELPDGRIVSSVTRKAYVIDPIQAAVNHVYHSTENEEDVSCNFFQLNSSSSVVPSDISPETIEEYRQNLAQGLHNYALQTYAPITLGSANAIRGADIYYSSLPSSSSGSASASSSASSSSLYTIVTSVLVRNMKSYWSGTLRGKYTVSLLTNGSGSIQGSLYLCTHYYENGNVQMKDTKDLSSVPFSFDPTNTSTLTTAILRILSKHEETLLLKLDDLFDTLTTLSFKDIRRALPVSGTKYSWSIAGHRMVKSLQQSNNSSSSTGK